MGCGWARSHDEGVNITTITSTAIFERFAYTHSQHIYNCKSHLTGSNWNWKYM